MGTRMKNGVCGMILLALLTACGYDNQDDIIMEPEIESANMQQNVEENTDVVGESGSEDKEQQEAIDLKASDVELSVDYEGEFFLTSLFEVGEGEIYLCATGEDGAFYLAVMEKETTDFQKLNIDMPKDARACRMVVDNSGKCHVLWIGSEEVVSGGQTYSQIDFSKSYITIMDKGGNIESTIDVEEIICDEKIMPYCFAVDEAGNYYIENKKEIIKIARDGVEKARISCEGMVECIGVGKSGTVYCTYYDGDDVTYIGSLQDEKMVCYEVEVPQLDANFAKISAGTDTDILLYNREGGVYVFDPTMTEVEERIPNTELPISGITVMGCGFLRDGRLCLMKQTLEGTNFYYIPAGE